MKKLIICGVVFCLSLHFVSANQDDNDPLVSTFKKNWELFEKKFSVQKDKDGNLGSVKKFFVENYNLRFGSVIGLRHFFSGDKDAREAISTKDAYVVLGDVKYIIEDINLKEVYPSSQSNDKEAKSVENPLSRLKIAKGYDAKVIVFIPENEDLTFDLKYISTGLLPKNPPGRNRKLRSKIYEQFIVTLEKENDKEIITKCKKDETFKSKEYVFSKTKDRIHDLAYKSLSKELLKKIASDLNLVHNNEIQRTIKDIDFVDDSSFLPDGPWNVNIFLSEKDNKEKIPEPVTISLIYDWDKDDIEIQTYDKNLESKAKIEQLKNIAKFIEKYLKNDAKSRAKMRRKSGKSKLPDEGKFSFFMNFRKVFKVSENTWQGVCFIRHSENFGKPIVKGKMSKRAKFICKVRMNDDGQLEVVEDTYHFSRK